MDRFFPRTSLKVVGFSHQLHIFAVIVDFATVLFYVKYTFDLACSKFKFKLYTIFYAKSHTHTFMYKHTRSITVQTVLCFVASKCKLTFQKEEKNRLWQQNGHVASLVQMLPHLCCYECYVLKERENVACSCWDTCVQERVCWHTIWYLNTANMPKYVLLIYILPLVRWLFEFFFVLAILH